VKTLRHVYFPTTSFISLVAPMGGKAILEVALAKRRHVRVPAVLGCLALERARPGAGSGEAIPDGRGRLPSRARLELGARQGRERYIHVLMSQLAQSAAATDSTWWSSVSRAGSS